MNFTCASPRPSLHSFPPTSIICTIPSAVLIHYSAVLRRFCRFPTTTDGCAVFAGLAPWAGPSPGHTLAEPPHTIFHCCFPSTAFPLIIHWHSLSRESRLPPLSPPFLPSFAFLTSNYTQFSRPKSLRRIFPTSVVQLNIPSPGPFPIDYLLFY